MLRGGRRACRNGRRAAAGQVGRSGHHAGEARRFLRDVRGDTVHPSTLVLLNELGLGARFPALRQRRVSTVKLPAGPGGPLFTVGDLRVLPPPYHYVAMVPQWDLLNLLADQAGRERPSACA
jgi:2-polyprenyl-6-methoxyphenol hydroxylase-like FAD-dependent oxidoreductase